MYIERRQPRANTPEGWADTLRRDRLAPLKLRFDPRWRVIRKHLAGPILDAGCGRGDWVAFLGRRGYEAIGLDYSEAMTSANRAAYPNCRFEAGRIQSMPFADKSFGGIVSWGVIEHDEAGPGAALAEFRRVLRPGGKALVTVPVDSEAHRQASRFDFPGDGVFFQHFYTVAELNAEVAAAGLSVVESGYCSRPHPNLIWPQQYQNAGSFKRRMMQIRASLKDPGLANMIYCVGEKPAG